jgi:hypothetical protein
MLLVSSIYHLVPPPVRRGRRARDGHADHARAAHDELWLETPDFTNALLLVASLAAPLQRRRGSDPGPDAPPPMDGGEDGDGAAQGRAARAAASPSGGEVAVAPGTDARPWLARLAAAARSRGRGAGAGAGGAGGAQTPAAAAAEAAASAAAALRAAIVRHNARVAAGEAWLAEDGGGSGNVDDRLDDGGRDGGGDDSGDDELSGDDGGAAFEPRVGVGSDGGGGAEALAHEGADSDGSGGLSPCNYAYYLDLALPLPGGASWVRAE